MTLLFLLLILPFAVAAFAAYFISAALRNKLTKAGNKYAKTISIVAYLGSFLIIIAVLYILIVYNVRFER